MCNIFNMTHRDVLTYRKLKITNYKYVERQTTIKNYEKTKH